MLDTSIIIDHIRSTPTRSSALLKIVDKKNKESFCISIISVQELFEGKSTKDGTNEKELLSVIAPFKILSYTYETAKLAGEISLDSVNPPEFPDAAIAATAIINGCELYTLNTKDFMGIKDLQLL